MAALTKDRDTRSRHTGRMIVLKVKGATKIYNGGMVAVVGGYAKPAADAATEKVMGIADEFVDNTGGADGALTVRVRTGVFKLANNAGAVVQADIGKKALVVDDQTVTDAATTNNIEAGLIEE